MSDENKDKNSGKDRKPGEVKVPPRNWLIWTIILVAIPVVIFFRTKTESNYNLISRQTLEKWLSSDERIEGKIFYPPPQSSMLAEVTGQVWLTNTTSEAAMKATPFRIKTRLTEGLEEKLLSKGFQEAEPNTLLMSIFVTVLPILLVAFLVYFFF